ncbi:MAG TPA: hypothetical protein VL382_09835, partial [Terriglobales bacterium]|nr:hypothetical protein [Terriglobales bacterium]
SGTGDIGKIDMKDEGEKGLDKPVSCEKTSYNGNGRKVSELKLGTEGNQKVVAVGEREDGKPGSQFALVRVVLRGAKGDTL